MIDQLLNRNYFLFWQDIHACQIYYQGKKEIYFCFSKTESSSFFFFFCYLRPEGWKQLYSSKCNFSSYFVQITCLGLIGILLWHKRQLNYANWYFYFIFFLLKSGGRNLKNPNFYATSYLLFFFVYETVQRNKYVVVA